MPYLFVEKNIMLCFYAEQSLEKKRSEKHHPKPV
ncbi:Uncharacterised protein [Porphyromonas macacae]|uniref:Uncharacterized protein n=1 Tax=Porphyromonas macacae TaxID=28115 RepID=A0A379E9C0_9PORP|nr:Uncharacterised protein [Porphyromonas macacae]